MTPHIKTYLVLTAFAYGCIFLYEFICVKLTEWQFKPWDVIELYVGQKFPTKLKHF